MSTSNHNDSSRIAQLADDQLATTASSAHLAFGELVNRHYSRVYAAAYAYVGSREAAEEVAQETFLRAYLHLDSLKKKDSFGAWVIRISRNLASNWYGQDKTRSRLAAMVPFDLTAYEIEDPQPSPAERAAANESTQAVQSALMKLPAADRELVVLHFMDDVSQSDIARQMGVYPSTIKRRLEKALAMLQSELGDWFTGAARSLVPNKGSAARSSLLIAAAAALSFESKAALAAAAGSTPVHLASHSTTGLLPHEQVLSHITSGGKIMAAAKITVGGLMLLGLAKLMYPESSTAASTETADVAGEMREATVRTPLLSSSTNGTTVANVTEAVQPVAETPRVLIPLQELASVAAEKCKITAPAYQIGKEYWASGTEHVTHWGGEGDTIEWPMEITEVLTNARLGVRYACHESDYMVRANTTAGPYVCNLFIDGNGPHPISFPNTDGWNWFAIASVDLPFLEIGTHTFRLEVPVANQAINMDAFSIYRGNLETAAPGPLRASVFARSEADKILVLASPQAEIVDGPELVASTFHQLLLLMEEDFGRTLSHPVLVHLVEKAQWDQRDGRAIKNRHGIYLLAGTESSRGDWCRVLAEYIADPQVPMWFRASLCRVHSVYIGNRLLWIHR